MKFKRSVLERIYIFNELDNAMNNNNEIGIVGKTYAEL